MTQSIVQLYLFLNGKSIKENDLIDYDNFVYFTLYTNLFCTWPMWDIYNQKRQESDRQKIKEAAMYVPVAFLSAGDIDIQGMDAYASITSCQTKNDIV